MNPHLEMLDEACLRLGELADEFVFIGGLVVSTMVTISGAAAPRETKDVDVIAAVTNRLEYHEIERAMGALGFSHDLQEPVICRFFGFGMIVDVIPTKQDIFGFSNTWIGDSFVHSFVYVLPSGRKIRVPEPPYFIALKLEAMSGRGNGDLFFSHDFEDIVAVINGRPEIVEEIRTLNGPMKIYILDQFQVVLEIPDCFEAIEGHLASMSGSYDRATQVYERIKTIAELSR